MALVIAVERWRPYLLGRHFIIITYHFGHKYIIEQKITTSFQSKWLPKLMGFDYEIIYKQGKDNMSADGLSRIPSAQLMTITISTLKTDLLDRIKGSWLHDEKLQSLVHNLSAGHPHQNYQWTQNLLYRKGKSVVGSDLPRQ